MTDYPQVLNFQEAYNEASENAKQKLCAGTMNLLLGNGFSQAYYGEFGYETLYKAVEDNKQLSKVRSVFEYLGESNFEGVLQMLQDSAKVDEIYGLENSEILNDYEILKNALAEAITKVHPHDTGMISDIHKKTCLDFLKQFNYVFTVNYDLLLYWTIMAEEPIPFTDFFTREEDTPTEYCEYLGKGSGKNILFLHGALHILQSRGQVFKRVWKTTGKALIDQIKEAMDSGKYPLVVAEGNSESKLKQIKGNQYLRYVYSKLTMYEGQMFVFGFSFSDQDKHITEAIARNPSIRFLYVGIRGDFSKKSNQEKLEIIKSMQEMRKEKLKEIDKKTKKMGELEIRFFNTQDMDIWGKNNDNNDD